MPSVAVIIARVRRWLHCLFRWHYPCTIWVDGRVAFMGCSCRRIFFLDRDKISAVVSGLSSVGEILITDLIERTVHLAKSEDGSYGIGTCKIPKQGGMI